MFLVEVFQNWKTKKAKMQKCQIFNLIVPQNVLLILLFPLFQNLSNSILKWLALLLFIILFGNLIQKSITLLARKIQLVNRCSSENLLSKSKRNIYKIDWSQSLLSKNDLEDFFFLLLWKPLTNLESSKFISSCEH